MKNCVVLKQLKQILHGIDEAEAEAKVILAHVQNVSLSELHLRLLNECENEAAAKEIARRRAKGRPLAYILNSKWFYGREYYVDERVLIPRYDTECVVEAALAAVREKKHKSALDLCCGSGCIGITLSCEGDFERVILADISEAALLVAQKNIRELDKKHRCSTVKSDLLAGIDETFDLIVCNPPYVSEREYQNLDRQIKEYEPQLALVAQDDGYAVYRRLIKEVKRCMHADSTLVLEIGNTQLDNIKRLLLEAGFDNIKGGFDLAGRPRFITSSITNTALRALASRT